MRKRCLSVFFAFCFATFSFAGKTDSLYKELEKFKGNDTAVAAIKYSLAFQFRTSDPQKALVLLHDVFISAQKNNKKKLLYRAYNLAGICFRLSGKPDSAIWYHDLSYKLASAENDFKTMAMNSLNVSNVYTNRADYKKALEMLGRAESNYEKLNEKGALSSVYNNMGLLYEDMKDMKTARKYHEKSLVVALSVSDSESVSRAYSNIARLFDDEGQIENAIEYYNKSIKIDELIGDRHGVSVVYLNLGALYYNNKNSKRAREYYEKSLEIKREVGDKKGMAILLNNLAKIYEEEGAVEKAIELSTDALKYAKQAEAIDPILSALESLAGFHAKEKNFQKSYEYHVELKELNDSIFNADTRDQIVEMQNKYEADSKEKEIALLNKDKELSEAAHKKDVIFRYFLGGVALLIGAFAIVVFIGFRNKQKANVLLSRQKEEISSQRDTIERQKHFVEEKNKEVMDSIHYAKRIQTALLTSKNYFEKNIPGGFFIFYRPKDIVSGDFYWALHQHNKFYVCTADCTGHGVPGAFMSMLNINFLNEVIIERGKWRTNEILDQLRLELIHALNPNESKENPLMSDLEMKDGMDCMLCAFDFENKLLEFSGANNPLWICSEGQMNEYRSDKMPVGKSPNEEVPFSAVKIELKKNDLVYSFTDGYADQFGGPQGKKFRYKPFKELLVSGSHLSVQEQEIKIAKAFENWKGGHEQLDDVLVIGIKI